VATVADQIQEKLMMRRVKVTVTGIVQGVNFRYHTRMTAQSLGVCGWVRNLPTGEVEGCFEGEASAVAALVDWCRSGPPGSRVDSIQVSEEPFSGEFDSFTIRR
jgi:acylphosphatase